MKYEGSCLCRQVKFEVEGDFDNFFFCHCDYCRKDTGSAHAANLFSSTAELKWLSGEKMVKTFDYQSSGHIKSFCLECGSALPNIQMNGSLLVVPAGSLDVDVDTVPSGHIYCANRANWDNGLENVRQFSELPDMAE